MCCFVFYLVFEQPNQITTTTTTTTTTKRQERQAKTILKFFNWRLIAADADAAVVVVSGSGSDADGVADASS